MFWELKSFWRIFYLRENLNFQDFQLEKVLKQWAKNLRMKLELRNLRNDWLPYLVRGAGLRWDSLVSIIRVAKGYIPF